MKTALGGSFDQEKKTGGSGTFTEPRDHVAILQSKAGKSPQEYGPLVEQYLRNLSDQGSQK